MPFYAPKTEGSSDYFESTLQYFQFPADTRAFSLGEA